MLNHQRKLNRLKSYDYSKEGYYFVTICTKNRQENFGNIEDGEMVLNKFGEITEKCWYDLPNHYLNSRLDEFVIMPNHVHGIVVIVDRVGNGLKPFPTKQNHGLSEIIRGFKTFSSRRINELQDKFKFQWQKSFYDHVIRNEKSLSEIRKYIQENPMKWHLDKNNPENLFM